MRYRSPLSGSEVWEGDCRTVAARMPDDSFSLAIFDGPYAMQNAQAGRGYGDGFGRVQDRGRRAPRSRLP